MEERWQVKEPDPDAVRKLSERHDLDSLLAKCILNRNLHRDRDLRCFLKPECYEPPDPYLIPEMGPAVERIDQALAKGERICIYGDYDADGVTAIAILTQAFSALGGDTCYYVPDRFFEGVGLNCKRLELLQKEHGVGLLITVDTGVRAFEEMAFAREIGLDVIITDHHTPHTKRPAAFAVLNPKLKGSRYPFDGLCGAGVALKIVQALDQHRPEKLDLDRYTAIAAIGTIADMVPLLEENRWIVFRGLKAMDRAESGPIRGLLRKLGIRGPVTALDISYKVAPRINAPGRLGDPDTAISFFDCTNPKSIARTVDIMDGMNSIRQMLERDLEAKIELQLKSAIRGNLPPFLMVAGPHWHRGILGITACKLLRRFNRPACVLSFDSEMAHGSIRGPRGINLLDILDPIAPLLSTHGGHPEAAGVSLPVTNIPQFKARMSELITRQLEQNETPASYAIDAVIDWRDLDSQMFENLRRMAPFGIGNALPIFLSANLILESELLRHGPWFHFEASDGSVTRKCSYYHPTDLKIPLERFDSVDLVYSLTPFRDEYQVQIIEIKPSKNS